MCAGIGGNSANTDRKETLAGYGDLNKSFASLSKAGTNLTSAGESDTGKASRYYSAILSGNPAAVMQAAAPEINAIGKQSDAQKKDIANFGNRTGGTNQTSQAISTTNRGQVADVISGKRDTAAGAEAGIGAGETGAGLEATKGAAETAANIASISGKNREISQKIHDAAVKQWADVIAGVISGGATGGVGGAIGGGIGAVG